MTVVFNCLERSNFPVLVWRPMPPAFHSQAQVPHRILARRSPSPHRCVRTPNPKTEKIASVFTDR